MPPRLRDHRDTRRAWSRAAWSPAWWAGALTGASRSDRICSRGGSSCGPLVLIRTGRSDAVSPRRVGHVSVHDWHSGLSLWVCWWLSDEARSITAAGAADGLYW